MYQTIVNVVLPVPADGIGRIEQQIAYIRTSGPAFAGIPGLHFLSMMVFGPETGVPPDHPHVTPLFVLEANIDGAAGPFWAKLEALLGEALRDLLRCCSAPDGNPLSLFHSVTQPFSRAPIAPLLEQCSIFPSASHRGNRGLSRTRILRHDALFAAVQAALPGLPPGLPPAGVHAALRTQLMDRFPWLDTPWQSPIAPEKYITDLALLVVFYAVLLTCAAIPWLLAAWAIGPAFASSAALLTGAACLALALQDIGDLPAVFGWRRRVGLPRAGAFALLLGAVATAAMAPAQSSWAAWIVLLPSGIAASLLLLLSAIRQRERADGVPAGAVPNPALLRKMQDWEQRQPAGADHMGSVVIVKPGGLRAFLVRLGLRGIDLTVRVTGKQGYLGSIASNRILRSIHFANWSLVDGGTRLMFMSNFDGSWDSYLDDFIEKESVGLTLAWCNGLGFPSSRYLALDGAAQGRQFKAWARLSMAPTALHFAAYPHLTVNHVARQAGVAQGLAARVLHPDAARLWIRGL